MPSSARAIAHLANTLRASLHVARRAAIGTRPACSPPSVSPKPTGNTTDRRGKSDERSARQECTGPPNELPSTRSAQRARENSPNIRSGPVGGLRCYSATARHDGPAGHTATGVRHLYLDLSDLVNLPP